MYILFFFSTWCLKILANVSVIVGELSFYYTYRFVVEQIELLIALYKREGIWTGCCCIMI